MNNINLLKNFLNKIQGEYIEIFILKNYLSLEEQIVSKKSFLEELNKFSNLKIISINNNDIILKINNENYIFNITKPNFKFNNSFIYEDD